MPAREVTVTQTTNQFGARQAKRTGASMDESRNRVTFLIKSR